MHKLRIIRSKYNGKGYLDNRLEEGEVYDLNCDTNITINLDKRGNLPSHKFNPCYDPHPVKIAGSKSSKCC